MSRIKPIPSTLNSEIIVKNTKPEDKIILLGSDWGGEELSLFRDIANNDLAVVFGRGDNVGNVSFVGIAYDPADSG